MSYSEIKKTLNSTMGTSNFKPLNEIINKDGHGGNSRTQVFKENGIFYVPQGIEMIRVSAVAAKNGQSISDFPFLLEGDTTVNITVGTGNTVVGRFVTLTVGSSGGSTTLWGTDDENTNGIVIIQW